MGKGSKAPSEQTVVQTNIPDYAEPYFMSMMDDATSISSAAYTPYQGQRLADQSGDILSSYDMTRNIAGSGIPYLGESVGAARNAMGMAQDATQYDPYQFSQYGGFNAFDYGDPQMWNSQIANQYMSPYIQNVLDTQKNRALLDFNRMQQYRDAEATKAGAFGGSRGAVVDALAQEALGRDMQEIDAMGLQRAYEDASRMFQSDRDIGFQYQGAQAGEDARVQSAIADELARVQGSQAGENLAAAGFGMDALGMYSNLASQLAGFGEASRAADIQGAQLLEAAGTAQQAYDQAGLDIAYQDFLSQRDWDQDQLSWMSDILRGVPVSANTTQTSYVADNPLQDALGLGISAIGLYNGLS